MASTTPSAAPKVYRNIIAENRAKGSTEHIVVASGTSYVSKGVSGSKATQTITGASGRKYSGYSQAQVNAMESAKAQGGEMRIGAGGRTSGSGEVRGMVVNDRSSGSSLPRGLIGSSPTPSLQPTVTPINQQQINAQNAAIAAQTRTVTTTSTPMSTVTPSTVAKTYTPTTTGGTVTTSITTQAPVQEGRETLTGAPFRQPFLSVAGQKERFGRAGEAYGALWEQSKKHPVIATVVAAPAVAGLGIWAGTVAAPAIITGTTAAATRVAPKAVEKISQFDPWAALRSETAPIASRVWNFAPNLVEQGARYAPPAIQKGLTSPVGSALARAGIGTAVGITTGTAAVYTRKGIEYIGETTQQKALAKELNLRAIETQAEQDARKTAKELPIYKSALYGVTAQSENVGWLGLGGVKQSYFDSVRKQLIDKGLSGAKLDEAMALAERRRQANVEASTYGAITGELTGELTGGGILRASYGTVPSVTTVGTNFFKNWASAGWKIGLAGIGEAETQYVSQELAVGQDLKARDAAISGAVGFGTAGFLGGLVVAGAQAARPVLSRGTLYLGRFVDPLESVGDVGASTSRNVYRAMTGKTTREVGTAFVDEGGQRISTVLGTTEVKGFFGKPVRAGIDNFNFVVPTFSMPSQVPAQTEMPSITPSFSYAPTYAQSGSITVGVTPPAPYTAPTLYPTITPVKGGGTVPTTTPVPSPADTDTPINNFSTNTDNIINNITGAPTSTTTTTMTNTWSFAPVSTLSAQPYMLPPIPPLLFGTGGGGGGSGGRGRRTYVDEVALAFGAFSAMTGRNSSFPQLPRQRISSRAKGKKGKSSFKAVGYYSPIRKATKIERVNRAGFGKFNINTTSKALDKAVNKAMK